MAQEIQQEFGSLGSLLSGGEDGGDFRASDEAQAVAAALLPGEGPIEWDLPHAFDVRCGEPYGLTAYRGKAAVRFRMDDDGAYVENIDD